MADRPNMCLSIIVTGACAKGKTARATTPTQTLRCQAVIESLQCIDFTHVQIQRLNENNTEDINCKCTFSINTQVICNHKLQIVDVVCHWPSSVYDAHIFDNSVVKH